MTKYAFYEQEIDSIGMSNFAPSGLSYVEVDDDVEANDLYIKDGSIKVRSICPGDYHSFNISSETWIDNSLERLPEIKLKASKIVSDKCSTIRSLYITDVKGQEVVYTMKRDEAVSYLNDSDPDLSNYPLIAAEIGITGPDAYSVAQIYINMNVMFVRALAALENIRLITVTAIETSATKSDVDAALSQFDTAIGSFF